MNYRLDNSIMSVFLILIIVVKYENACVYTSEVFKDEGHDSCDLNAFSDFYTNPCREL